MANTSAWKLRRLASRAKRVQARRSSESPVLAVYTATLPIKVDAFVKAYDDAAKYQNTWRREMKEGKGAVAKLVSLIRALLPLLVRDVPQFNASDFGDKPDVPDDIIEDGNRLLDILDEATDASGNLLNYSNTAKTAIAEALVAANKEWAEAEGADSHYQKLLADVRATASVFDLELQTFRRSLAHVAGRSDKDFQKLRVERAAQTDDEDDPAAPAPPAPVTAPSEASPSNNT
jgi:hypothetical protein